MVKIFPVLYSLFIAYLFCLFPHKGDFYLTFVSIRNLEMYCEIILKMKVL